VPACDHPVQPDAAGGHPRNVIVYLMGGNHRVLDIGHGHVALVEVALHAVIGQRIAAKHEQTETGAAE